MPPPDDPTRIAEAETRLDPPSSGRGRTDSGVTTGWLSSSDGIDHGRFPPGTILGGRYRIVGRLGRGGMGEVFRADDLKLGQAVALKFLPAAVDRDPARLTQLHTEVRMARQVSHPNVCRVYDIDEVEGHTFLSMEYVDGEDLASLLRRFGRLPQERALEVSRQICAGLAAAHERGVVHRDLKPANVMLDGAGKVRIADFGLAGVAGEALRAGTPTYMAPEQLAGGEVTQRSDIYALGLVLYEVFTGQRAVDAKNLAELIRRRELADVVTPSSLVRDLPPEVDRAIMRCLEPEPESRPSSAIAVAAALPGGDPLAAALAAGETPSPEMVAAAGEAGTLSRGTGTAVVTFALLGLLALTLSADRVLLVGHLPLDKPVAVLVERAREVLAHAGVTAPVAGQARGIAINGEYLAHVGSADRSAQRWSALRDGRAPALRFWYRTSPRDLLPLAPNWTPSAGDPPLTLGGMSLVALDDRGRLLEFVTVPLQVDPAPPAVGGVNWEPFFAAAGLPSATLTPVDPLWTPRVFADRRQAWEGPSPFLPDTPLRIESAEFRGRPVAFHVIAPWTRPVQPQVPQRTVWFRVITVAGTVLFVLLLAGAIALVRANLKSGRADRQGAVRVMLFLLAVWTTSWALGATHSLDPQLELRQFLTFLAFALINIIPTGLFYLALEPFVRRFYPDILISWTRLLGGQVADARVGRDVLIGIAVGVFLALIRAGYAFVPLLTGSTPPAPLQTSVQFLLGDRYTLSSLLRVIPNALQGALLAAFFFVLVRALVGRTWIVTAIAFTVLTILVLVESGGTTSWAGALMLPLFVVPLLVAFLRYGVVTVATALIVNQMLGLTPLTADLLRPQAGVSTWLLLGLTALALYTFRTSGAGRGLLKPFLARA